MSYNFISIHINTLNRWDVDWRRHELYNSIKKLLNTLVTISTTTTTGDTICDEQHPVILESMEFPEPVIELAIEPKTKAGQQKMGEALAKLAEEDPTFRQHTDQETNSCCDISGINLIKLHTLVSMHPVILESMEFPEPVIELAIEPKTKAGQGKLGEALAKLAEEDPTFRAHTDQETGQTIIAGMGELHLEIIVDRLLREFKDNRMLLITDCITCCCEFKSNSSSDIT